MLRSALLIAFASCAIASDDAAACTLRMGWSPFPPMAIGDDDAPTGGLEIRLVSSVLADAGCAVDWRRGTWNETLHRIRTGDVDGTWGATRTTARETFARFTMPHICDGERLFMRAADPRPRPTSLVALAESGLRIGIERGSVFSDEFERMKAAGDFDDALVMVADGADLPRALLEGRIDGLIRSSLVVALAAAELRAWARIEPTDLRFGDGALRLMFSKASVAPETLAAIDGALKRFVKSADYEEIYGPFWSDINDVRPYSNGVYGCGE